MKIIAFVAVALTAINMRAAVTALSPLVPIIAHDLGLSGTAIGALGTIPTAMFAASALLTPKILRATSGPRVLLFAMALTALGQIIRVLGPSVPALFGGSVIALFAVGITNAAIPLAVRAYFPHAVPRVSMVYLVMMQIGMLAAPLTVDPVADMVGRGGWQVALALWAVPAAAAAIAWLMLFNQPRSEASKRMAERPRGASVPVWRTSVGLGLTVMFGFTSFVSYAMMMFVPAFFVSAGADTRFGALMLSVWSGMGLVLAAAVPRIVEYVRNPFPFIVAFATLFFIGNTGMATAPLAAPWVWVICSSLGPMTFPMALTLLNVKARTMEGATGLSSFCQGAGYVIACGGPFLMGFLRQVTDGWFWPNVVITIGLVLIVVGGWFATRSVYVEDQLAAKGIHL